MRVRVLLFGVLKERIGRAEQELELPTGARVAEVVAWASGVMLDGGLLRSTAVAVNREYVAVETELRDGDEVALLPPVSGGACEVRFGFPSRLINGCT